MIEAEAWDLLAELPDDRPPDSVAVESWFAQGCSVASAWREGDRVVVSVSDHDDLASTAQEIHALGDRGRVIVCKSLEADPALRVYGSRRPPPGRPPAWPTWHGSSATR